MKIKVLFAACLTAFVMSAARDSYAVKAEALPVLDAENPRRTLLFDFDWRFLRGALDGWHTQRLDDSGWRTVDLPHDWSIEDIPGTDSPLDPLASGGISSGYFVGGVGIYRKHFFVPKELKGKRIHVRFDGVYMNADVRLNGKNLGNHPYGYTSFGFDVTDEIKYGKNNLLAVEVKNEGANSRWYSGSGIYRHVWLDVMNPVHISQWGTAITTPEIDKVSAVVEVEHAIENHAQQKMNLILKTSISDGKGNVVAQTSKNFSAGDKKQSSVKQRITIPAPKLWSPDAPNMYTCTSEIMHKANPSSGETVDRISTPFGIRKIEFSAEKGFLLNGEPTLMRGGCVHHDNGPLGAAAYDRAEERRVALLKASGYNAIRCAHNPPSPAFLDACDRLGMLVIDEAFDVWDIGKEPYDYQLYFNRHWETDLRSMILRDRNHPSIVMWSTGNEIPNRASPAGVKISQMLADYVRELDPTRPVTAAVNGLNPGKDPFFATLDIAGYNYGVGSYKKDHKRLPERIIYGSETYPLDAYKSWMPVLDLPYVIGDFVWTSFDYLGEAGIGWLGYPQDKSFYPWSHAFCGDIDICGFKRPQSFYRDVLWKKGQLLSVFVEPPKPSFAKNPRRTGWSKWHWHDEVADWNWAGSEGIPLMVRVYCAHEEVELFLNEESLGKKLTNRQTQWIATYKVPFAAGTLRAVAYKGGREVAQYELSSAQDVQNIKLTADRPTLQADGQDLCYVTAELLDVNGIRHPKADNLVSFEISGPGRLVAVASSNPMSADSYQGPGRHAWQGRVLAVVRAGRTSGTVKLRAACDGMPTAETDIEVVARQSPRE